ncbi:MAG TPA: Rrf2 family transcriptional regulator [Alphaproteobacteria bacterium]|nr:Rrf2 family transcriptional regulator [Alphaproteobacteria bacterium]
MRLTLYTDYALRVLMYVGVKAPELATIGEIAEQFDTSKNHLMKVVHELGQRGYLETVRGKHGGMRLARKPRHINIGAVVRDTEEDLAVVGCLQQEGYCPIERVCELRLALREATHAFLGVLDRYTLEDLIRPRRPLSKLLAIELPEAGTRQALG